MPKTLATTPSVWSKVFRAIVAKLRADPDFNRLFGKNGLRSWDGSGDSGNPMVPSAGKPLCRLTPMPGNVDWYSPDSQAGVLAVKVELAVQSLHADDPMDLWDVIVMALRPANSAFTQHLISLGAETGEIVFADPAYDATPASDPQGFFSATGRFRLTVLRSVNP